MCDEYLAADLAQLERDCVHNLKRAVRVSQTGRLYESRNQALGRLKVYKTILRRLRQMRPSKVASE